MTWRNQKGKNIFYFNRKQKSLDRKRNDGLQMTYSTTSEEKSNERKNKIRFEIVERGKPRINTKQIPLSQSINNKYWNCIIWGLILFWPAEGEIWDGGSNVLYILVYLGQSHSSGFFHNRYVLYSMYVDIKHIQTKKVKEKKFQNKIVLRIRLWYVKYVCQSSKIFRFKYFTCLIFKHRVKKQVSNSTGFKA